MSPTMPMLDTYPREMNLDRRSLALAIDTIIECGEACTACADACLSEGMVADLAVVERDPLVVEGLRTMPVFGTLLAGEWTYRS